MEPSDANPNCCFAFASFWFPTREVNPDSVRVDFASFTSLATGLCAVSLSGEVGVLKLLEKGSSGAGGHPLLGIVSIVTVSVLSQQRATISRPLAFAPLFPLPVLRVSQLPWAWTALTYLRKHIILIFCSCSPAPHPRASWSKQLGRHSQGVLLLCRVLLLSWPCRRLFEYLTYSAFPPHILPVYTLS